MELIFWLSAFQIIFTYFGYPVSLKLLSYIVNVEHNNEKTITPSVSFIITVYNEENRIKEKLKNTINLDYPKEKVQIIVSSDGSTDRTHEIVEEFKNYGVHLLINNERKGKEYAQAQAIKIAKGEILVFSDAATKLDKNGLKQIISNFSDSTIGCVSSEDKVITKSHNETGGESFYVRYEMWLRKLESGVKSVVGLSGSFFAARKEVCEDFSSVMQSDFRTLLNTVKKGMRGVCDPEAKGYYFDIEDNSKEFERKIRTVLRGLTVFLSHLEFINFFRYGLFSYQYLCHKMMRWLVPIFMIFAFSGNAFLSIGSISYRILFLFQIVFYSIGLGGILKADLNKFLLIRISSFFMIVNSSILIAWIKYIKGERVLLWQPSLRNY
ncbi:MAG: glycosyltransferase family 2 protein [Fibrobacter sp.]|nr:glycosyltransferase family 2 protein [Fibrobacter sp.]